MMDRVRRWLRLGYRDYTVLGVMLWGMLLGLWPQHTASALDEPFAVVFNQHHAIMLVIDPVTGEIEDANPAAVRFYGYTRTQLRNLRIQDINTLLPDQVEAEWQKATQENRNYFIFQHRLADGEIRTVAVYSSPIEFKHGRRLLSIIHDITPTRQQAEDLWHYHTLLEQMVAAQTREIAARRQQKLQWLVAGLAVQAIVIVLLIFSVYKQQRARRERDHTALFLQNILDNARDFSIIATNPDGIITVFNPGAERLLGYRAAEVVGYTTPVLFHDPEEIQVILGDQEPTPERQFQALVAWRFEQDSWISDHTYICKDGQRLTVHLSINVLRDNTGEITGYLGIAHDVTAQRRAEQDCQAQARLYRGLVESQHDLIVRVDTTNRFTYVNDAYCRMFGKQREELIGHSFAPLVHQDDITRTMEAMDALVKPPYRVYMEQRAWTDKGWRWLAWEDSAILDDNGHIIEIQGVGRDITVLKEAQRTAEAASRAKSAFLASVSHEVRTPLNAIIGFGQILGRDRHLSAPQREQVQTIVRSSEHLLMLLSDVLDFSQIEADQATLHLKVFNLHDLLHELASLFRVRAEAKGLRFILDCHSAVPRGIEADEAKLRQVISNLLSNAIKFTAKGSVTLRVSAATGQAPLVDAEAVHLSIVVEDTGIGISAVDQTRIFEAFQQTTAGRQLGGTGLGLAISQRLIELMGGQLVVSSQEGKGSRFMFAVRVKTTTLSTSSSRASAAAWSAEPLMSSESPRPPTREAIAALPLALIHQMQQALAEGDMDQLDLLIHQVAETHAELAHGLKHLAAQYDYTTLGMVLDDRPDE